MNSTVYIIESAKCLTEAFFYLDLIDYY